MLDRIRKALGRGPTEIVQATDRRSFHQLENVMPPITPHQVVPKFEEELGKVAGETHRAASLQDVESILQAILEGARASGVVLSRNPLLRQLQLEAKLRCWGKSVSVWGAPSGAGGDPSQAPAFREQALAAEVGITGVDFVLAESGTLVLSSVTEGSQLASLAPPVHVALYRRDQVFATLEEVLERIPLPADPGALVPGRSVVFITGPSRTADIEQILIRGVHGPRHVHAILVEEACLG